MSGEDAAMGLFLGFEDKMPAEASENVGEPFSDVDEAPDSLDNGNETADESDVLPGDESKAESETEAEAGSDTMSEGNAEPESESEAEGEAEPESNEESKSESEAVIKSESESSAIPAPLWKLQTRALQWLRHIYLRVKTSETHIID